MKKTIKNLVDSLKYSDVIITKEGIYTITSAHSYECEIRQNGDREYPLHKISRIHFYNQFNTIKSRYEQCRKILSN